MQPTSENLCIKKLTTKYTQGKTLDSRNTHETIFGPTKYLREKRLDQPKTYEKKFRTHKIPTRKYFEPTINPQEKISDPVCEDLLTVCEDLLREYYKLFYIRFCDSNDQ